jgi:hypothetical protein
MIQKTKCIACLHPATPEEREDYKEWRKDRGHLRRTCGKPKGKKNDGTKVAESRFDRDGDVAVDEGAVEANDRPVCV